MKRRFLFFLLPLSHLALPAQDLTKSPWHVPAGKIDPNNYLGVMVANGMIGIVSS